MLVQYLHPTRLYAINSSGLRIGGISFEYQPITVLEFVETCSG